MKPWSIVTNYQIQAMQKHFTLIAVGKKFWMVNSFQICDLLNLKHVEG